MHFVLALNARTGREKKSATLQLASKHWSKNSTIADIVASGISVETAGKKKRAAASAASGQAPLAKRTEVPAPEPEPKAQTRTTTGTLCCPSFPIEQLIWPSQYADFQVQDRQGIT